MQKFDVVALPQRNNDAFDSSDGADRQLVIFFCKIQNSGLTKLQARKKSFSCVRKKLVYFDSILMR
jgi:hypothetical protein